MKLRSAQKWTLQEMSLLAYGQLAEGERTWRFLDKKRALVTMVTHGRIQWDPITFWCDGGLSA